MIVSLLGNSPHETLDRVVKLLKYYGHGTLIAMGDKGDKGDKDDKDDKGDKRDKGDKGDKGDTHKNHQQVKTMHVVVFVANI